MVIYYRSINFNGEFVKNYSAESKYYLSGWEFLLYWDIVTSEVFSKFRNTLQRVTVEARAGGGQNLERRNVERSIFRNLKIANTEMTKDELFDSFIIEFICSFFINYLNNQNI